MAKSHEFKSCPLPPKIGETIYIGNLTHPIGIFRGGQVTVTEVKDLRNGTLKAISAKSMGNVLFDWDYLGPRQERLKKEFGNTNASFENNRCTVF